MFDLARAKMRVREWALAQNNPHRKQAQKEFPNVPAKIIRQVLQSVRDSNVSSGQEDRGSLD